jgi:hypothetical protein
LSPAFAAADAAKGAGMALPTDAKIDLILCDGVRPNPDGKLDLAGFYPTGEVQVDPTAKLPATINLTFVFVVRDGDGQFRPIFRIIDPLGKELHKYDVPEFKKPAHLSHVMMLPVALIPIARSGNYVVSLEFDGQHYRRQVRIFQ